MSEEVNPEPEAVEFECGLCGASNRTGCDLCQNDNTRFRQTRHYTLSEERQGLNPDAAKKRYGPQGEVGPEQIHDATIVMPRTR
jgi:hypothetical protein